MHLLLDRYRTKTKISQTVKHYTTVTSKQLQKTLEHNARNSRELNRKALGVHCAGLTHVAAVQWTVLFQVVGLISLFCQSVT